MIIIIQLIVILAIGFIQPFKSVIQLSIVCSCGTGDVAIEIKGSNIKFDNNIPMI